MACAVGLWRTGRWYISFWLAIGVRVVVRSYRWCEVCCTWLPSTLVVGAGVGAIATSPTGRLPSSRRLFGPNVGVVLLLGFLVPWRALVICAMCVSAVERQLYARLSNRWMTASRPMRGSGGSIGYPRPGPIRVQAAEMCLSMSGSVSFPAPCFRGTAPITKPAIRSFRRTCDSAKYLLAGLCCAMPSTLNRENRSSAPVLNVWFLSQALLVPSVACLCRCAALSARQLCELC